MWGVRVGSLGSPAEDSQVLEVDSLPSVTSSNPLSLSNSFCNLLLLATWLMSDSPLSIYLVHGRVIILHLLNRRGVTS